MNLTLGKTSFRLDEKTADFSEQTRLSEFLRLIIIGCKALRSNSYEPISDIKNDRETNNLEAIVSLFGRRIFNHRSCHELLKPNYLRRNISWRNLVAWSYCFIDEHDDELPLGLISNSASIEKQYVYTIIEKGGSRPLNLFEQFEVALGFVDYSPYEAALLASVATRGIKHLDQRAGLMFTPKERTDFENAIMRFPDTKEAGSDYPQCLAAADTYHFFEGIAVGILTEHYFKPIRHFYSNLDKAARIFREMIPKAASKAVAGDLSGGLMAIGKAINLDPNSAVLHQKALRMGLDIGRYISERVYVL
ncbi:hypothetical protein HYS31_05895 [Candidatus Woesearchaeota archaeon]|nr:hypothetical protein [Candidatus Woesearchaeota archaeon]